MICIPQHWAAFRSDTLTQLLQVLGGAGPAIAAVPLTVVWAGTSAVSLLNNIRTRQVGPVGAVQRVGFVLFTGVGQIISAFSRMGAATMTYLPPSRTGHLTDRSLALCWTLSRFVTSFSLQPCMTNWQYQIMLLHCKSLSDQYMATC